MRSPITRYLLALLGYGLITFAVTFPFLLKMGEGVNDRYDPLLNAWILAHDLHRLGHRPLDLFNADIFWPHRNTLALNEHQLANALLIAPVYGLTNNPLLAYNAALLLSFVFSGFAVFCLVHDLTGKVSASLVAGLLFSFSLYRFNHLSHLQTLTTQWLPLSLLFLRRMSFANASWKTAAAFGLCFGLNTLSSYYHALFGGVVVGLYVLLTTVFWKRFERRQMLALTTALGAVVLINVPLALPYYAWSLGHGARRTRELATYYSARPADYLVPPLSSGVYAKMGGRAREERNQERWLFPGAGLYMLALVGALLPLAPPADRAIRAQRRLWVTMAIACFVLSLGPSLSLANGAQVPLPYEALYRFVPGFQALRVPARFALWMFLALACLAGIGFASLVDRFKARTTKHLVGAAMITVALVELWPARAALWLKPMPVGEAVPQVISRLAPENVNAVAYLPMGRWSAPALWAPFYLYLSTYNWVPCLNGYGGFAPGDYSEWSIPGDYRTLSRVIDRFPETPSVSWLGQLGVDTVVVFRRSESRSLPGWPAERLAEIRSQVSKRDDIRLVETCDEADVYRITLPETAPKREM